MRVDPLVVHLHKHITRPDVLGQLDFSFSPGFRFHTWPESFSRVETKRLGGKYIGKSENVVFTVVCKAAAGNFRD